MYYKLQLQSIVEKQLEDVNLTLQLKITELESVAKENKQLLDHLVKTKQEKVSFTVCGYF